jgi:hypothetical protein
MRGKVMTSPPSPNPASYEVCAEMAARAIKKTDHRYLNFFKGCPFTDK